MRLHAYGQPLLLDDVEAPRPGGDEVVVRVTRAGVNPVDIWAARGTVAGGSPLPRILGGEASGITEDGRRVVVRGAGLGISRDGTYAEQVTVPPSALARIPDGVSDADAASVGVVGVTALDCLDLATVTAGETLLVLGASGGVGSAALQLARGRGVRTVAQTTNPNRRQQLAALADVVVVADTETLVDAARNASVGVVDAALDALGDGFTAAAVRLLRPGGKLVMFGAMAGPTFTVPGSELYRKNAQIVGYGGLALDPERLAARLDHVLEEVAAGHLRPVIAAELPLADANEAHRRILAREAGGKLLLVP